MRQEDIAAELADLQQRWSRALDKAARMQPVPVGTTPRAEFLRHDPMTVYRYAAETDSPQPVPLVLVYSLVNRPYILDLKPERSVIRAFTRAGYTVYLVDWGFPEPMDRFLTLDDYINDRLRMAVDSVAAAHHRRDVHMVGVCQGGTLGLCYAALHPQTVRSLTTLVTPVDFHTEGNTLRHLAQHVDIDALVDATGNVSSRALNGIFSSLKPLQLFAQRYVDMTELTDDDAAMADFLRMEQWMYDSPDQAGEAFRQFAKDFYQENRLIKGELTIGNRQVSLSRITMPVFNCYAAGDHLVPPASAQALRDCVAGPYHCHELASGHLGTFISGRAHRTLYPELIAWLAEHSAEKARG